MKQILILLASLALLGPGSAIAGDCESHEAEAAQVAEAAEKKGCEATAQE